MTSIAKVAVEIALDREFDYRIPERLQGEIKIGSQVVVPFGKTEVRGYVIGLSDSSPVKDLKEIRDRVGQKPLIGENIMSLARWIAEYYAAPIENALRTVLPGAVRRKGAGFKERLLVFPTEKAADELAVEMLRKKAPKQAAVLDVLLGDGQMFMHHLTRSAKTGGGAIRLLEEKGFVRISRHAQERDPLANQTMLRTQPLALMPQQAEALALVRQSIDTLTPPVVLLHGVTGSGKTEVYLQAIDYVLNKGRGAIMLVPEIALTPQTIERFRGRFGECIALLHSSLSEGERHDEWHRVHEGRARIAIGARSALFAPVRDLGLIVVDEEHEPTYKQEESPRYNARDVAVMRGRREKCAVLLGSATPSIESFYNAGTGKYGMIQLPHRVDHRKMPVVRIVDMRVEAEREGRPNVFSRDLVNAIQERLKRAEQTMLFLNRRGFASSVICTQCGYVANCGQCSVAMTYHKKIDEMICHVCGRIHKVPSKCPECSDPTFRMAGYGTQRVEEIVKKLFPHARVQRMDSDTTTKKDSHRRILGEFRTGKIDILVGTQMIAKGLHFPNITLVGVISADLSLHMPDFRASERTFQLLTQVAGRAGRGEVAGEVIVQTYTPFHPAIQAARRLDYGGFYDQEIEFRRELKYPPFSRMVCVTLRGVSEEKVMFSAKVLAESLAPQLSDKVAMSGPAPAPIEKMKGQYRHQLIFRAPTTALITDPLKKLLKDFAWPEGVSCAVDVDAISML